MVDAVAGQPFHTAEALGGIVVFTAVHFLLNVVYAVVLLSAIHQADRAPSLVIAALVVILTLQGAFGMLTNLLTQLSVGNVAWIGIFGGSLLGTVIMLVLLSRTHPLLEYLHRAEAER
jgi:hypothetical protein